MIWETSCSTSAKRGFPTVRAPAMEQSAAAREPTSAAAPPPPGTPSSEASLSPNSSQLSSVSLFFVDATGRP